MNELIWIGNVLLPRGLVALISVLCALAAVAALIYFAKDW